MLLEGQVSYMLALLLLLCSISYILLTCCGRQTGKTDPRSEPVSPPLHKIRPIHTLLILWRCLPDLPWGLHILQLISVLLTSKPELYKGNKQDQRATELQAISPRTACPSHTVLQPESSTIAAKEVHSYSIYVTIRFAKAEETILPVSWQHGKTAHMFDRCMPALCHPEGFSEG